LTGQSLFDDEHVLSRPAKTAAVSDDSGDAVGEDSRTARIVFGVVVGGAALLYYVMGRHQWFFYDEWDFLASRTAFNVHDLLRPHNEHWSTIPILAYRALWWMFGLRTYRPYQALSILTHLSVGVLLRAVMRRSGVSPWVATAAASLFVLLGSGAQDIIWAFQIGYVGAIVFGLIHLLLASHDGPLDRRDYLGLAAGLAALMCSGVAVTMVIVVGVAVLLRRGWRMAAFHVGPLGTLYVVWWLSIGHRTYVDHKSTLPDDVTFVRNGTSAAFSGMGQIPGVGLVLAAMLVVGLVLAVAADVGSVRTRLAMPIALLLGAFTYLAISSIGRPGLVFSGATRYIHVFVALAVPAIAVAADAFVRRWRVLLPVVLVVLLLGVPGNIRALRVRHPFQEGNPGPILTAAQVPLAKKVPRTTRPYYVIAPDLPIGWLLDGVASGKIPAPRRNTALRSFATFSLSLSQLSGRRPLIHCRGLSSARTFRLSSGQRFTFRNGPLHVVSTADRRIETTFDPGFGDSLLVRARINVSMSSASRRRLVTLCT
jgi:hypothetical protein